jgi:hypothetical protein
VNKRDRVRLMFGGKCAYCGVYLEKTFHMDHVEPIYRGWVERPSRSGIDVEDNLFPSCPRCNLWKKAFSVEEFRNEISLQIERLRKYSAPFRLAESFGMIKESEVPIVFWFEKYKAKE